MKNVIIIFFLFIFQANAQSINGRIIDSTSGLPICFANITYLTKNYGTYSNEEGYFNLDLVPNEKILITSIGYFDELIAINYFTKNKLYKPIIKLKPKIELLDDVVISSIKKKYSSVKTTGFKKKLKIRTSFPFGYEFCTLIKNPYKKKGLLKTVILSFNKKKEYDYISSYNIKFYSYNNKDDKPGELLYHKNLIITPENKTYKHKINIDSLAIPFLKNGVCIGIEIINIKYPEPISAMSIIAPKINFTHSNEKLTWTRYRKKEWNKRSQKSQVKNTFSNALINIEFQLEK